MNLRLGVNSTEDDHFVVTLWSDDANLLYPGRQTEFRFVGQTPQEALERAIAWATHNGIGENQEETPARHVTPRVPPRTPRPAGGAP